MTPVRDCTNNSGSYSEKSSGKGPEKPDLPEEYHSDKEGDKKKPSKEELREHKNELRRASYKRKVEGEGRT